MGMLLVPPYRSGLSGALADVTAATEWSDGPMVVGLTPAAEQSFWVDGLDSI